jgi:hypothetical protein
VNSLEAWAKSMATATLGDGAKVAMGWLFTFRSPAVICVHCTKKLDSAGGEALNCAQTQSVGDMERRPPRTSYLPSFLIPCPYCGGRMTVISISSTMFAADLEDITHGCKHCGTELTRTVSVEVRGPTAPNRTQTAQPGSPSASAAAARRSRSARSG